MSENITELLEPAGAAWSLAEDEARRQAIPALRGYAYQLHASLAAWIQLPDGGLLYLEAAEDYAEILRDPASAETVLAATQVKDTRESGSVTLNSPDVKDAIRNYWALRKANPGRTVRLIFMTTSPMGREQRLQLPGRTPGLAAWAEACAGGAVDQLRSALMARFPVPEPPAEGAPWSREQSRDAEINEFLVRAPADELRAFLAGLTWACGAPSLTELEADNSDAIVELGDRLGATPELSRRAAETLLVRVLRTILEDPARRLTRAQLLASVESLTTVRVPAQLAAHLTAPRINPGQALIAAGAWRTPLAGARRAQRSALVARLHMEASRGTLWLHGATGLGKTTLAELVAISLGGHWRLLDLRDIPGPLAAERLRAARAAMASESLLAGLLIDDLPTEFDRELEAPLSELRNRMRRHGQTLLVTSRNPAGHRLASAGGAAAEGVQLSPAFDEDEVAELIAANGGDAATWARFVWFTGGSGHPQLVDVMVQGLAGRGWPREEMRQSLHAGFRHPDVDMEREAVRQRLLTELTPETYNLLIRTTRIIGSFDRPLVMAVAATPPPVANAGQQLDRLTGHWVERLGNGRLRTSPLVARLAEDMLTSDERRTLDRRIAEALLTRGTLSPDQADAAAMHASLAEADELLSAVAYNVVTADSATRRSLATAMPIFRTAGASLAGSPPREPLVAVIVRLAEHLLFTAGDELDQISASVTGLLMTISDVEDPEQRRLLEPMVILKVLMDEHVAGRLPEAFALIDRLEALQKAGGLGDTLRGPDGEDPVAFAFLLHAVQGTGRQHLEAIFQYLESLSSETRQRRLAPFRGDAFWMGLAIDNAWLADVKREALDARNEGDAYKALGERALAFEEHFLAARCFRVQAVMLDEYANDPDAAITALDRADERLPNNVVLLRARAKIAWRARNYELALSQLLEVIKRREALEPLERAFVLREAGQSAGELARWSEAADLFERASQAASDTSPDNLPFVVGLQVDAAASRFAAGDRIGAVRTLASVFETLSRVDALSGLQARFVHLIARHVILWMSSCLDATLTIGGEEIAYRPGAASNLDPSPGVEERPVTPIAPAWWMLARLALDVGVPIDEVLGWAGVQALRGLAVLEIGLRRCVLQAAIARRDTDAFGQHLRAGVEAMVLLASPNWQAMDHDPLAPAVMSIPTMTTEELLEPPALDHLEDAVLAMAAAIILPAASAPVALLALQQAIGHAIGSEVLPSLFHAAPDNSESRKAAAGQLRRLATGEPLPPRDLLLAHLRILHALAHSSYKSVVAPLVAARLKRDWTDVLDQSSALLVNPMRTAPPLRAALGDSQSGFALAARIALLAVSASGAPVDARFIDFLRGLENDTA